MDHFITPKMIPPLLLEPFMFYSCLHGTLNVNMSVRRKIGWIVGCFSVSTVLFRTESAKFMIFPFLCISHFSKIGLTCINAPSQQHPN